MFFNYLSSLFLHFFKLGQILSTKYVGSNTYCSVIPQLPNVDRADPVPE